MSEKTLKAISTIDGRYANKTSELVDYFSEFAFFKYRILVEIEYLIALSKIEVIEDLNEEEIDFLKDLYRKFNIEDCIEIKEIEKETNHDVKSIEYYLKKKIDMNETLVEKGVSIFVHFGLTSEDVNNVAQSLMLKGFVNNVYLPIVKEALELLKKRILDWSKITILTHTHGQPASPSFMGKELMVYYERFVLCSRTLNNMNYRVKFGGAIGNFNSMHMALPNIDWIDFSNKLMRMIGLERNQYTTQINHNDNICELLDNIKRINNILLDLNIDIWLYISKRYLIERKREKEIGSSTMPHKINPINFENSEGNLSLCNNILSFLSNKLPISRLQRDLSNSTIIRNLGYPLSLSIISFKSFILGFNNININNDLLYNELNNHFEIITEGIATRLKILGIYDSYESLLNISRNSNTHNIKNNIHNYIQNLNIPEKEKKYLFTITPHNYTGIYKL